MPDKINLSKLQKDTLLFFSKNDFAKNFYWTGGTLLSYFYLHHRDSVDLDFFSDNLFTDEEYLEFVNQLKKELKIDRVSQNLQYNRRLYLLERGKENIKLELVFFPFPAIEKRKKSAEFRITIDSLVDIMTNKILATYQRNETKDLFDLYFYLCRKPKYNFFKLIAFEEKKFGIAIEPVLLMEKINELINNLDSLKPLLFHPEKNLNRKIKSFFQDRFNEVAKKNLL